MLVLFQPDCRLQVFKSLLVFLPLISLLSQGIMVIRIVIPVVGYLSQIIVCLLLTLQVNENIGKVNQS